MSKQSFIIKYPCSFLLIHATPTTHFRWEKNGIKGIIYHIPDCSCNLNKTQYKSYFIENIYRPVFNHKQFHPKVVHKILFKTMGGGAVAEERASWKLVVLMVSLPAPLLPSVGSVSGQVVYSAIGDCVCVCVQGGARWENKHDNGAFTCLCWPFHSSWNIGCGGRHIFNIYVAKL